MLAPRFVLSLLLASLLTFLSIGAGETQGSGAFVRPYAPFGNDLSLSTSRTAAITASATTVSLAAPSTIITVLCAPSSSNVYVNFAGTATTSNFEIPTGFAWTFEALPPVSSFSIIGDGTTGTYSVFAH